MIVSANPRPPFRFTSVVVPLYNEAASLWQLYEEIVSAVPGDFEILFVDDGSEDDSFSILCVMQERDARVRALRLRGRQGKAVALAAGFYHARGEAIVTIDADLQDDPAEIPRFLAKLKEGYDIVSGWRLDRKDLRFRKAASVLFNSVASLLCGHRFHDLAGGFKAYRREVVEELRLHGGLHRFVPILAAARGFRATEMRVSHRARPHGRSRYGRSRYWHALLDCLAVAYEVRFGPNPSRLFSTLGLAIAGAGVVLALALGDRIGLVWRISLVSLHVVAGLVLIAQGFLAERLRTRGDDARCNGPLRDVLQSLPPERAVGAPTHDEQGVRG